MTIDPRARLGGKTAQKTHPSCNPATRIGRLGHSLIDVANVG